MPTPNQLIGAASMTKKHAAEARRAQAVIEAAATGVKLIEFDPKTGESTTLVEQRKSGAPQG